MGPKRRRDDDDDDESRAKKILMDAPPPPDSDDDELGDADEVKPQAAAGVLVWVGVGVCKRLINPQPHLTLRESDAHHCTPDSPSLHSPICSLSVETLVGLCGRCACSRA